MDKSDLIRLAPAYYELAVLLELQGKTGYMPEFALRRAYTYHPGEAADPEDASCYIEHNALLKLAIKNLVEQGAIEALLDPFGPSQYREGPKLDQYMLIAREDPAHPLFKGEASGDAQRWLRIALENLNTACNRLDVTESDWNNPEHEWEPIPIDRSDNKLQEADRLLDETIAEVEKNNGYAVQHPQERNFVLENLRLLSRTLKTATETSAAYVRTHGLDVLKKLAIRFAGAVMEKLADGTAHALMRWLGWG
jgi:hypothetical protein